MPDVAAKRAAIYARVSTAEQVEGTSLQTQVASCQRHLQAQGWALQDHYVDEGVSGAKARRPALDRLLEQVANGTVDVVVVAKLDRIGRSMRHLSALLGELDDRGVVLVSVSESFDSSTASGRLQRNMLGSFAEFEREQIRERLSAGRDATVRQGKYVSTYAPYGLAIDTSGDQRRLVINADEADTIRLAIDLFVNQRLTTGQVAPELNARGLRPRLAPRWYGHALRPILSDSHYLSGTWTWRHPRHHYQAAPITMTVPAIIDAATHERLRARLAETTRRQSRRPGRYLLSGRLFSPHGTLMYGLHNPAALYRCKEVFANNAPPAGPTCDCRPVRADHAETFVWEQVCALLTDPDRLMAMAGLRLARGENDVAANNEDLTVLDRRIARLEKAAGEQLSRLLVEGVDPAVISHAAKDLDHELASARRRRHQVASWQAANADSRNRAARLAELATQARQILPVADHATKTRILDLLDVKVHVEGFQPCPHCNGIGYISNPAPATTDRPGRNRGNADKICPTCRRHRWLPQLSVEGTVPDTDLQVSADDSIRWPFKLVSGR